MSDQSPEVGSSPSLQVGSSEVRAPEVGAPDEPLAVSAPGPGPSSPSSAAGAGQPRVRDRQVVVLALLCVAAVLGTQLLDILVPPFDRLLGFQPTVAVMLVVVTAWILVLSIRSARRH
jgi:hypothetical protein